MNYNSIILSGLPCSGKSTLARKLSEIYDWPVYSIGKLFRDEWERLYPNAEISFEEYWRNTTIEDNRRMDQKAREIFGNGKVIGDIRYSINYMDLPALLVFVTANSGIRAKRGLNTGKYNGKSLEEIEQILYKREMDELKVGKDLYGPSYDYRDPKYYHLILNSGLLTVEEEVFIVTSFMSYSRACCEY